jgi:pimeloyl-ACP methyl ester carboxylesterase
MAAAHTLLREIRAFDRCTFDALRFKNLQIPTLLLLGGDSLKFFQDTTETVDKALPNSEIVVLLGQKHIAMDTAPDLFVNEVLTFLLAPA